MWAIDVRGTFDVGRRFAPLINQGEDLTGPCLTVQVLGPAFRRLQPL